jgi:hypothetical protein
MLTAGGLPYGTTVQHAQAVSPGVTCSGANLVRSLAPSDFEDAKIAVVKPIFSDTVYDNAFYVFFAKYAKSNETYITTDLNYLNVMVKYGWSWSANLYGFLASDKAKQQGLFLGKNVIVIDDINVTEGGLFHNGKRAYDVLILGFTEYVTSAEYYAYKDFVAQGGTLIIFDSCDFQCEVKYSPPSTPGGPAYLSLVKGKGWEFNGTHAWKSVYGRWEPENRNWIGSNYWFYWNGKHYDYFIANTSDPISASLRNNYGEEIYTSYGAHEESLLQNFTDTSVIGYWHFINPSDAPNATVYPGEPVAAYRHRYMNGTVFRYGIMASDRIMTEEFLQAFLISAIRVGLFDQVGNWCFPRDSAPCGSLEFSSVGEGTTDSRVGLSGIISCVITLNATSMARGGVIFNLTSVILDIRSNSTYTSRSSSLPQPITIQANKTDESGLSWEAIVNTRSIPDGDYVFEVKSYFVSSVNNTRTISQSLSITYSSIDNVRTPLRNVLLVVSASAVVPILVFVFYAYGRDRRRKPKSK